MEQQESQCEDGHRRRISVFLQMPSVTADSASLEKHHFKNATEAKEEKDFKRNLLSTSAAQIQQQEVTDVASGIHQSDSSRNNDHGKRHEDKVFPKQSSTRQSGQVGFLPPLKAAQPVQFESHKMHSDRCAERLPPIEETGAGRTRGLDHNPADVKLLKNTMGSQQTFLPRLVPEANEGCFAPVGLLTGKKGPGRQSSLAFLQKLSEESSDPRNLEVVRGVLPLELRDLQGQSVGSLILGPDGEIIQISMFDNIQHSAREHALEVVSAKGERLPWVVLLQPENHQLTDKNEMQMVDIKQDHNFDKFPDFIRHGAGSGSAKVKFDPDAVENRDYRDSKSVTKLKIKRPKLAENIVSDSSSLDETEEETNSREDTGIKDKKDIRSGQLPQIQQLDLSTSTSNEKSAINKSPMKQLHKMEKRKDRRSSSHQNSSGTEREGRITAHDSLSFTGSDDENKTTKTNKGVKSKEAMTKKTNNKSASQGNFDADIFHMFFSSLLASDLLANEAIKNSEDSKGDESRLNSDKYSRSLRSLTSGASGSRPRHSSNSQKSLSSSCEGGTLQGNTAVVTEQPIKEQDNNSKVLAAEKAKLQKQEEVRKRREQEEEQRRQQQKVELEQRMKNELQNERQRRAEEARLKKQTEEEERQRREEEEQRRKQREQERREREIRMQQEKKRQMEHFQRMREEEEQRRKAEANRLKLLEEKRLQEENLKLQEMTASERVEYLRKKQEENNKREIEEEEHRKKEEEAALINAQKAKMEEELLAREMALLHQRLSFKRGLMVETEGLERSQGISRPWTYSYFTLLQLLSLSTAGERHMSDN
ncbi:hypothetical protein WMY93_013908 [Mugilogobius chulae]|uniref:Uncharacterized protein n=1 Tax=Mugilogobius chulae TaxID=88201 RepID=A0AAW0PAI7_9GOBI